MNIQELRDKLHNKLGKFKCSRCGKEVYIPYLPEEKQKEWGIFAWTAFLAMYIKWQSHWTILKGWTGEFICPDCHKDTYEIDDRKLSRTDEWLDKYSKWRKELNK